MRSFAPGRSSSGIHSHTEREEAAFILEGSIKATVNGKTHFLGPGDFIGFLPGEIHVIKNDGGVPARLLLIASNPPGDEVVYAAPRITR